MKPAFNVLFRFEGGGKGWGGGGGWKWLSNACLQRLSGVREQSWKKELALETPVSREDTHWSGHKNEPLVSVGCFSWVYKNVLLLPHTHAQTGTHHYKKGDTQRLMITYRKMGEFIRWGWRADFIHTFPASLYGQAKPHWANQCTS